MTGTDATSGNKSGFIGDTFHLELCEGQILTRRDIDAVSLYTNQLIKRIRKLMNKLSWHLKGTGAFGWRYGLIAILTKVFYHLHLISERDAIGYAKGLHNMWMIEKAEKAGLRVVKVDL